MEPRIKLFWEPIFPCVYVLRFSGETIEWWRHRFSSRTVYCECGKKHEEGNLLVKLANIYLMHYKYLKARELYDKELYDKAINITKEMGDRKNEAYTNEKVGIIPQRFCFPFVRVIHFNRNESFSSFLAFILLGLRFFLPSGFSVKMKTAYKSS